MPDIAARRWLFLLLVLASVLAGVMQLWSVLRIDGLTDPEWLFLVLFAILFGWIGASFWMAVFGAWAIASRARLPPLTQAPSPSSARTAILMPVYNEDVARVFCGVEAIRRSVAAAGGKGFDFFILSDSTDPAQWIAEEVEWQRLSARAEAPVFYRHRHKNTGRKSGNIQDFCENWGTLYDYMVVLDADSLMSGATLVRLVALMDANPRTALIQAPPRLVGRRSLFARIQQFASSIYGPVITAGLAWLQGPEGNYWGHNAIIRVHAFMAHGGLPNLSGKPPFGGEIMSHDFVEAALLVRAGWDVWMAPEPSDTCGGSFEEPPPTIYDHLKRDRRWCQGNLQHLRIVFAQGLKMPSRLHLAMGIMAYVSSPLWLMLLIVSAISMQRAPGAFDHVDGTPLGISHAAELVQLVLATVTLLYGPKLIALILALRNKAMARAHGGRTALLFSALGENLFSTLFAPIMMLAHAWFVFSIVMGLATGWGTQQRQDRALPFWFAVKSYWPHTMAGLAGAGLLYMFAPASIGWFVPLLTGLLLAIPLAAITSSLKLGEAAARQGLFLVPSETGPLPILDEAHRVHAARAAGLAHDFPQAVLEDRNLRTLHLQLLNEAPPAQNVAPEKLAALVAAARQRRTEHFTRQDWIALLSDPQSLAAAV